MTSVVLPRHPHNLIVRHLVNGTHVVIFEKEYAAFGMTWLGQDKLGSTVDIPAAMALEEQDQFGLVEFGNPRVGEPGVERVPA